MGRVSSDDGPSRPVICALVGLLGGVSALGIGHGLSVVWPSFGGPQSALLVASMTAVFVVVASAVRGRFCEAVAIAGGAALGLVGVFVVGNWYVAGGVVMPRPWVLWSLMALLVAYGLLAAAAAATRRTVARRWVG